MNTILYSFLSLQLFYIRHGSSTMPVNCLKPLNTSDCDAIPTRVFSYYKSGSRCELEVWRGCPTENKFETEEECSEHCIFKDVAFGNKLKHKLDAKCTSKEDLNNCNDKIVHGFKYDNLKINCVEVATNCPGNIFEEKLECIQSCVRDLTWVEKIKLMSEQQSKEVDNILEKFANSTTHDHDSKTPTTDSGELKTTDVHKTDVNGTNTTGVTDAEDKKLHGDETTTESYENKGTGGNSTSTGNHTGSVGIDVTKDLIDNDSNTTSNSESVKETTNQNMITTANKGTPTTS